jgi:RimJ/RimL family protein N-acetyltransferase
MIICDSNRLSIRQLKLSDAEFMVELLNEESFIRYIADKNVRSIADAEKHLEEGPLASYKKWGFGLYLVELKTSNVALGLCGLLKREELEGPDLGFAFLPKHCGQGYAVEAATRVLQHELYAHSLQSILAITRPDNHSSNQLLRKVGFVQTGVIDLYDSQNNFYQYTAIT